MKALIWISCILVDAIILTAFKLNGVILGGIPSAIIFGLSVSAARGFCNLWDDHKKMKQTNDEEENN